MRTIDEQMDACSGVDPMTLTEFLLARIAEDETAARAADPLSDARWEARQKEGALWIETTMDSMGWEFGGGSGVWGCDDPEDDCDSYRSLAFAESDHVVRWQPTRVLAECEAKRRIVELHEFDPNYGACRICALKDGFKHSDGWGDEPWPCSTIRILALPYADHPDWREEWRP